MIPLIKPYRTSLISAGSISLDSTFKKKQFDSVELVPWYRYGNGGRSLVPSKIVGALWGLDCQTENFNQVSPVGTVLKLVALLLAVVTVPRSASTSLLPFYI
jgi:hypothetical protein